MVVPMPAAISAGGSTGSASRAALNIMGFLGMAKPPASGRASIILGYGVALRFRRPQASLRGAPYPVGEEQHGENDGGCHREKGGVPIGRDNKPGHPAHDPSGQRVDPAQ